MIERAPGIFEVELHSGQLSISEIKIFIVKDVYKRQEEGFPLYFANQEMVALLGYQSFGEFSEAIRGRVINTIHPDDRLRVVEDIGDLTEPGTEYITTYRMMKKNGGWFWALDKGKVIRTEDGRPAIISA